MYFDGGTISSENPTGYYYDTPTIQLAAAAKEGYTFKGWYTDSAFKNKITKIKREPVKLQTVCKMEDQYFYNIVFDGNGANQWFDEIDQFLQIQYKLINSLQTHSREMDISLSDGVPKRMAAILLWRWCNSIKSFPYKWSNSKTICTVGSFVG